MDFADRARELAAKLQMERDIATFPDRPLAVFAVCTLSTMSLVHQLLYDIANEPVAKTNEPVAKTEEVKRARKNRKPRV